MLPIAVGEQCGWREAVAEGATSWDLKLAVASMASSSSCGGDNGVTAFSKKRIYKMSLRNMGS